MGWVRRVGPHNPNAPHAIVDPGGFAPHYTNAPHTVVGGDGLVAPHDPDSSVVGAGVAPLEELFVLGVTTS